MWVPHSGWIRYFVISTGAFYYSNELTGKTSFVTPPPRRLKGKGKGKGVAEAKKKPADGTLLNYVMSAPSSTTSQTTEEGDEIFDPADTLPLVVSVAAGKDTAIETTFDCAAYVLVGTKKEVRNRGEGGGK